MTSLKQIAQALTDNVPARIADGWSYLDQIPQEEFYRLIVDGNKVIREKGPLAYERREEGCIQAFMHALRYCREMRGRRITFKDLLSIHALVSSHNKGANRPALRFDRSDVHMSNHSSNTSQAGILQYLDAIEGQGHVIWGTLEIAGLSINRENLAALKAKKNCATNAELAEYIFNNREERNSLFPPNPKNFTAYFGQMSAIVFLNSYYYQEKSVVRLLDRIRLMISSLSQPLEVVHLWSDCNLRTSVNLLLNTLLMNEGFPPAIFEDPNIFDLHAVDECLDMTVRGMNYTLKLIKEKKLAGFDLSELPVGDINLVKEITSNVDTIAMQERLKEFDEYLTRCSASAEAVYQRYFAGMSGDPLPYLEFIVKTTRVAEVLPVARMWSYFEAPLKPLDQSINRSGFWVNRCLGLPTWLTGDHSYQLAKDAVSEAGLCCLFDKMTNEGGGVHVRIGLLSSQKDKLFKFSLGELKEKYSCDSNAKLASFIYSSEDHWPLYHFPIYNDTDVTVDECLKLVRKGYEDKIKLAKNYLEKILVIVDTIQELCLVMPYSNDNPERLVPLIDKLLLENGLPPTTGIEYPDIDKFILFSPAELAKIVIKKCCVSLALIRGQLSVAPEQLDSPNILTELNQCLKALYKLMNWSETAPEVPVDVYRVHIQGNGASIQDSLSGSEENSLSGMRSNL